MPTLRAAPAALLMLLLGACTGPQPLPDAAPGAAPDALPVEARWALHRDHMAAVDEFTAIGKVGYEIPGDAGSASLRWEQHGDASELRLSGPLGVGSTRVTNEGGLLRVRRDGIERLYPADAAPWLPGGELLPIPVASLHHWLRGIPDPALKTTDLELSEARAARFTQGGWIVEISDYRTAHARTVPTRLALSAPEHDLRLRVILRNWEFSSAP